MSCLLWNFSNISNGLDVMLSFFNNRMVTCDLALWAFKAGSNVWDY